VWDKTVPFLEGLLHFVTFIDDSSRKVWIYFLKHKSDAFDVFKKLLAQVENESGWNLKCLKSNNRSKYCNARFEKFCLSWEIRRVKTDHKNSHQNRVTEHMNLTILECARSIRIHTGLLKHS